jgi:hypothetical protein
VFDFRYHAVSLVAVFMALAIGLLLGVAIGDAGLVSSAERRVRDSLDKDIDAARADANELRSRLALRTRFENELYPQLVAGRLAGATVGLVFLGRSSDRVNRLVRDAVLPAGGRMVMVGVVREPLDRDGLASRARGTRYGALDSDPDLIEPFGVRLGIQVTQGGRLLTRVRSRLWSSFNGTLAPLSAVVVARDPSMLEGEERSAAEALERGLARGLRARDVPVVGVETTNAKPSQIPWYSDRELSSVDNLDDIAGRTSLVFTLAGAQGSYGVKATAQALLPQLVTREP